MQFSPLLEMLISQLKYLPGVGPKSAQRMAYHLLQRNRNGGVQLAHSLKQAMLEIGHCEQCRTFTEESVCAICRNPKRQDSGLLCVVESPADILAIEQTGQFSGRYFVLLGHLSPIDGIGPVELGLEKLRARLQHEAISEVILATNPTIEGEATANYIADLCQDLDILVTRIAHGVPVGGELEMVDGMTLSHSFIGRQKV